MQFMTLFASLVFCDSGLLPTGKSTLDVLFGEVPLKLYIYKPTHFSDGPMIMVLHGVLRNAEEYRDHSVAMGDRFGALIVSPLFDEPSFPKPMYQFGGIVRDGKVTPREEWTGEYINRIVKEIRQREVLPKLPVYLIGHSGGGQFLIRTAAFVQTDAVQIVAANPGTHLMPTRNADYPYGWGGLPEELQTDDHLRAYLAQPLTIYLGTNDTERDEHLDITPPAEAQGRFRLERGQHAFAVAKTLAENRQWKFGWKLVLAPEVEHDHEKMFNHPLCAQALGLPEVK